MERLPVTKENSVTMVLNGMIFFIFASTKNEKSVETNDSDRNHFYTPVLFYTKRMGGSCFGFLCGKADFC